MEGKDRGIGQKGSYVGEGRDRREVALSQMLDTPH
jgi:hypothetical protein